MSSGSERERYVLIGVAAIAVLVLLYSILIARNLFAWVGTLYPLVFLYLVWRFVRAHERVAAALERPDE